MEIDKPTLELLDEMGFVEDTNKKGLYETIIDNGAAFIDFRHEDGRRYGTVGKKNIPSKDADTIPILKTFKERRDEIKNKLLEGIGASQSSPKDGKEVHDTTKGKESKDEKDKLLIHAPGSGNTSGAESPQIKQPESQNNKQDSQKTKVEGETILQNRTQTTPTPKEGIKTAPPPISNKAQQPNPPAASQSPNLYEFFFELVGAGGIIEVFGNTGSLKSQLCTETCKAAKKLGKTFFYLDTEGKAGLFNKKFLGNAYQYLPIWKKILEKAEKDLPKADLLIVDSIGFPVSAKTAGMRLDEQGQAWNQMMSLVGDFIKAWAFNNNAIAIVTNQPKSEFMKDEAELLRLDPVGDKVHFAPNLMLRSNKTIIPAKYDETTKKVRTAFSIGTFTSHRSTDFMDDTILLIIHKNDDELITEIPENVTKRLKKLKE